MRWFLLTRKGGRICMCINKEIGKIIIIIKLIHLSFKLHNNRSLVCNSLYEINITAYTVPAKY